MGVFRLGGVFPNEGIDVQGFFPSINRGPAELVEAGPMAVLLLTFEVEGIVRHRHGIAVHVVRPSGEHVRGAL